MKVLNLRCARQHAFEGWFASEADFVSQRERALVACPLCADTDVQRLPTAPRIIVGRSDAPSTVSADVAVAKPPAEVTMQSQWMRAVRHVMANTEDVGERFPEEARRIHYGESAERGIRGKASPADAEALREEGIEIVSMPLPEALDGPLQ